MHWRTSCFFIPVNFYSLSGHCLPISVHFISHLFLCSTFPKHMLNCIFWVYLSSAKWLAQICHWIITETSSGFQPRYTHSLLFYWPQCHILYLFLQMWSWKAISYAMTTASGIKHNKFSSTNLPYSIYNSVPIKQIKKDSIDFL